MKIPRENRSKFISFFLRAKNKIFVQNNDASHIEIIKNILKRIGYEFNETALNTIDEIYLLGKNISKINNLLRIKSKMKECLHFYMHMIL